MPPTPHSSVVIEEILPEQLEPDVTEHVEPDHVDFVEEVQPQNPEEEFQFSSISTCSAWEAWTRGQAWP